MPPFMQPLQLEEHVPLELHTCPPHETVPVQAWHTHGPGLQYGVAPLQSEFTAQPTQDPDRQTGVGAPQLPLPVHCTHAPPLQIGVPPPHAPMQAPPSVPQCEASIG